MESDQPKLSVEDALLDQAPITPSALEGCKGAPHPSPLTIMYAAFLAFNLAMTVYLFNTGFGAISFMVFLWLDLMLLVYCLRLYNHTATGSPRQEDLKLVLWLLITMLILAIFTLLEFWFFTTTEDVGVENRTASQLQHQKLRSLL